MRISETLFHAFREATWLALTAFAIYAILYPITSTIDFIYWKIFSLFVFVTITYFRYAITFKSLPFLRPAWVRFVFFAVNFSLIVFLMYHEQKLLLLYENYYTEDFGFPKIILYHDLKEELFKYLYNVLVLFGTGSLIMIAAFQMRLIISYWQYYKHQANHLLES